MTGGDGTPAKYFSEINKKRKKLVDQHKGNQC